MDIGRSIKIGMAVKGIRNDEFARAVGISVPYLSTLKNRRVATGEKIQSMANALEMSVSEFVRLGENRTSPAGGGANNTGNQSPEALQKFPSR